MSQHYFDTVYQDDPITVILGWDRPDQSYFLIVERRAPAPGQDDYLYLSPSGPDAPRLGLDHFRAHLLALGIEVPASMFEQVSLDDQRDQRQTGRRIVSYMPDGSFQLL